jgi:hypothetical protein
MMGRKIHAKCDPESFDSTMGRKIHAKCDPESLDPTMGRKIHAKCDPESFDRSRNVEKTIFIYNVFPYH